jgi:hypothetical protein
VRKSLSACQVLNITKLFFIAVEEAKYDTAVVPGKLFLPGLIFLDKAKSLA